MHQPPSLPRIIGIDIGTHGSSVAWMNREGIPTLLPDSRFPNIFRHPSHFSIGAERVLIGHEADLEAMDHPDTPLFTEIKPHLGNDDHRWVDPMGRGWSATTLHALLMHKLRNDALVAGIGSLDAAVLAVPGYFHELQRRAWRQAAQWIQLPIHSTIENAIAATAFLAKLTPTPQHYLVYDFGGGNFEVSIVRGSNEGLSIIASESSTEISLRQLGLVLADDLHRHLGPSLGKIDPTQLSLDSWHATAMRGIDQLLSAEQSMVQLSSLVAGSPIDWSLTAAHLAQLAMPMIEQSMILTQQTLESMSLSWNEIDQVLLIGGGSRLPGIASAMARLSGLPQDRIVCRHPHHAIVYGATLLASQTDTKNQPIVPRLSSSFDLGIRIRDPRNEKIAIYRLIKKNSPLPAQGTKVFKTSRIDQDRMVIEIVQTRHDHSTAISLGHFSFGPLQPQSAHHPIEVQLAYDAQGMVQISARDPISGKSVQHSLSSAANGVVAENTRSPRKPHKGSLDSDKGLVDWALGLPLRTSR